MNNTNTGGPAFPGKQKALAIQTEHIGIASEYEIEHNGMTLRDYFAAKAIEGAASGDGGLPYSNYCQVIAKRAYAIADAMLAAR